SESIHLKDWPAAGEVDEAVMNEMDALREYVNQGLSLRAKAGIKVRQPLASVTVPKQFDDYSTLILLEELNVKAVKVGKDVALDTTVTPVLRREGLAREVIRAVQSARKAAGLQVDDRILLHVQTADEELDRAIREHLDGICAETLASPSQRVLDDHEESLSIEGMELSVSLAKRS
ncbi:hypothetical protein CR970_02770, partial [Candidatus Saccharibacteria bacterium]